MERVEIEYCRDRAYPTRHIALPRVVRLTDLLDARVEYARTDQLVDMRLMVEHAEKRGDNVGINEFVNDSIVTDFVFKGSEIFTVTNLTTNVIDAFIVIHHCLYTRGYDPCLATVHVFRAPSMVTNDVIYGSLVRIAVEFVKELDYGYTHVVMDVALCHTNLLKVLKLLGFTMSAIIPASVNISGIGLVENVILVKSLGVFDRPVRSPSEVLNMLKRCVPCDEFASSYPTMQLPQVPFLPAKYTFKCGIRANFRNMRKEEDEMIFRKLTESIEKGEGYGLNEYPSIDYFRMFLLSDCHCVVIEEVDTLDIIGFTMFTASWFTRDSEADDLYESDFYLNKSFRGKGIATEMMSIEFGIARELGYTRGVHDAFLSNAQMVAASRHVKGLAVIGSLPNAGYLNNAGWEDVMLTSCQFKNAPTFTELVKKNCQESLETSSKL